MHLRNKLSLFLILVCFGLLIPGVTLPAFQLGVDVKVISSVANLQTQVLQESRSIISTISDLYARDRVLVASLILLFSVVVPVIKGLILIVALLHKSVRIQSLLFNFVNAIGKWSMADVFVLAIFLVFLSTTENTNASREAISVFGMTIPLEIRMLMDSKLGPGFYWFLGYCMLSLISLHVIKKPDKFASDFELVT